MTETNSPKNLPDIVRDAPSNLSVADWSEMKPNLEKALRETIDSKLWPLFIYGPTGSGKSCASVCIYQRWRPHARWWRLEKFVRDIQTCRTSRDRVVRHQVQGQTAVRTEGKLWEFAQDDTTLWCIDDFGTRTVSEAAFDIVFELIDRRVGKPTIITSNLSLIEIGEMYDDRIADRLRAGTVIELTGESRRTGKRFKV